MKSRFPRSGAPIALVDGFLHNNVTNVLQRFNMSEAKPVGSTLPANCKLSGKLSPKTKAEKAEMMKVPYVSAVGSLMYAMVCTRPDIGYAVGSSEPVHE